MYPVSFAQRNSGYAFGDIGNQIYCVIGERAWGFVGNIVPPSTRINYTVQLSFMKYEQLPIVR